jgi:hypothetical protein
MPQNAQAMKKEACCLNWGTLIDYVEQTPNLGGGLSGRAAVAALLDGVINNPQFLVQEPNDPTLTHPLREEHLRDRHYWHSHELSQRIQANAVKVIGGYPWEHKKRILPSV